MKVATPVGVQHPVLAVTSGHPEDPTSWSGVPYQIVSALKTIGVPIGSFDASFGRFERWASLVAGVPNVRRVNAVFGDLRPTSIAASGSMGDGYRQIRKARIAREAKQISAGAALCLCNSGLSFPDSLPVTLVEDMTISQAGRLPGHYPAWDTYPEEYIRERERKQGEQQRAAQSVAFLSSWAADAAIADYGLDPAKTTVIGVGSRFRPTVGERDWSRPKFLFVGMDWKRKNGELVVEGFAKVREQHPDAELHLVGRHPRVDAPGVFGHGRLLQSDPVAKEKLAGLFAQSTCFVLPSTLEPSAVSYAEAISQGVPSIGTVHGGSEDIFGDAGMAIDPNVPGAVAAAMLAMAIPDRARELGAIALRRAPMLTWDAVARRLASSAGWWDGDVVPLTRVTPG